MRLCEGRDLHRVIEHKRGLPQLRLHGRLEHLVQDVAHARRLPHPGDARHGLLVAQRAKRSLRRRLGPGQVAGVIAHEVDAGGFLHQVVHRRPAPGPLAQVDQLVAVLNLERSAVSAFGAVADHLLGQLEHVRDVRVRLVHLDAGKFRVVPGADALVAEDAAHLVHALEAPDDEPLEVQLRGDAQRQVHAERVVKGVEWLGVGAPRASLQNRRLHLHESPVVQEAPDAADDAGARAERVPYLGVGYEVDVPLSIPHLHVGEPLELVGERQERLGEHLERVNRDGQLALLRPLDRASRADNVAHVHEVHDALERAGCCGVDALLVAVQLDAAAVVLEG